MKKKVLGYLAIILVLSISLGLLLTKGFNKLNETQTIEEQTPNIQEENKNDEDVNEDDYENNLNTLFTYINDAQNKSNYVNEQTQEDEQIENKSNSDEQSKLSNQNPSEENMSKKPIIECTLTQETLDELYSSRQYDSEGNEIRADVETVTVRMEYLSFPQEGDIITFHDAFGVAQIRKILSVGNRFDNVVVKPGEEETRYTECTLTITKMSQEEILNALGGVIEW